MEVVRRIRSLRPKLPVIVASLRADLAVAVELAELGVHGCLTPPLTTSRLRARMERVLRADRVVSEQPPTTTVEKVPLAEAAVRRLRAEGWNQSVGALAAAMGVSARRLRDAVREAYGISVKACMIGMRLQATLRCLRETNEPIKAAARSLGFYDAAHLARDVRRLTGTAPTRHRRLGLVRLLNSSREAVARRAAVDLYKRFSLTPPRARRYRAREATGASRVASPGDLVGGVEEDV
jgi:AraC-like DNA-binding protein